MGKIKDIAKLAGIVAGAAGAAHIAKKIIDENDTSSGNADNDSDDDYEIKRIESSVKEKELLLKERELELQRRKSSTSEERNAEFIKTNSEVEIKSCSKIVVEIFIASVISFSIALLVLSMSDNMKAGPVLIASSAFLLILVILFLAKLISIKNASIVFKEKIDELKSTVRIKKAVLVQKTEIGMKLTEKSNLSEGEALEKANSNGLNLRGSGYLHNNYEKSLDYSSYEYNEYSCYQIILSNIIRKYNLFIKRFPNCIYASILKLEKENFVGFDDLEKSLNVGQDEFSPTFLN